MKTGELHTLKVSSETTLLKKVLIHRPDEGIEKVTPERATMLLYEDIVFLPKMKEEHDVFTKALEFFIGKENVLDIRQLLADVLTISDIKNKIIDTICYLEKCEMRIGEFLKETNELILADTLISGILHQKMTIPIFYPLPNLIFTRDLGTMINNHLLISQASKKARSRESVICYFIFHYHPLFKKLHEEGKIISLSENESELKINNNGLLGQNSIEGGDVMMLSSDHLLIATSERTAEASVKNIIEKLFEKNVVNKITRVDLPKLRYCMHLDTVFTKITENESVVFEPLICKNGVLRIEQFNKGEKKSRKFDSLKDLILEENSDSEFIPCGEGIFPYDEREQWTDGCNLVTVKEGVAFIYDRNTKTNKALKERGFTIIDAREIVSSNTNPGSVSRTIMTIPSSELSRARGGPHCMTFPLERS